MNELEHLCRGDTQASECRGGKIVIKGRRDPFNCSKHDVQPENCYPLRYKEEIGQCCMCVLAFDLSDSQTYHKDDVFNCNGWILCGDHRYELRNGRPPARLPKWGRSGLRDDPASGEHGCSPAPHTLNRKRHQYCRDVVDFERLCEIEGTPDSLVELDRRWTEGSL